MWRKIIAILLAGGGSGAAASAALSGLFKESGLTVETLLNASNQVGAAGGAAVVLPIIFYFLRGVTSYLTSVVIMTALAVGGLLYLDVSLPIEQMLVVSGVASAVAVAVYRIIT